MYGVRKIASLLLIGAIACILLAACGSSSSTLSGQVPTVVFARLVNPITGLSVTFSAAGSSDPDGSAPTYLWNFGDGNTDTVVQPTHLYAAAGTYTVTLTVTGEGNSVSRVQTVTVTGGPAAGLESWTWVSGSQNGNSFGTYETNVVPTAALSNVPNMPSARQGAVSWTDAKGQLWLFGGYGYDSTGIGGYLNDLWRFNVTSRIWTWVNGSNRANAPNIGVLKTPAATNMPGARSNACRWTDASGNFWLFGGTGWDDVETFGYLNDMWIINSLNGEATWITGSNTANAVASYGVQGVASPANTPGARSSAACWTDKNGTFWLFGGQASNAAGTGVALNDLWMFDPAITQWTWKGGSSTATNVAGVYGTQGVGSTANLPGSRLGAQSWTDGSGNFWLFGGSGYDSADTGGIMNDMWSFNPTTLSWTWVAGSPTVAGGVAAVYGTEGAAAAGNTPGSRLGSIGWTDASGNLWLFGGGGYGTTGAVTSIGSSGEMNDLWSFTITSTTTTGQWALMSSPASVPPGVAPYGLGIYAAQDSPSVTSTPGARMWSAGWVVGGELWLFGGAGVDTSGVAGDLNDLWNVQLIVPSPQ
jgi:PKD repeat protein